MHSCHSEQLEYILDTLNCLYKGGDTPKRGHAGTHTVVREMVLNTIVCEIVLNTVSFGYAFAAAALAAVHCYQKWFDTQYSDLLSLHHKTVEGRTKVGEITNYKKPAKAIRREKGQHSLTLDLAKHEWSVKELFLKAESPYYGYHVWKSKRSLQLEATSEVTVSHNRYCAEEVESVTHSRAWRLEVSFYSWDK